MLLGHVHVGIGSLTGAGETEKGLRNAGIVFGGQEFLLSFYLNINTLLKFTLYFKLNAFWN